MNSLCWQPGIFSNHAHYGCSFKLALPVFIIWGWFLHGWHRKRAAFLGKKKKKKGFYGYLPWWNQRGSDLTGRCPPVCPFFTVSLMRFQTQHHSLSSTFGVCGWGCGGVVVFDVHVCCPFIISRGGKQLVYSNQTLNTKLWHVVSNIQHKETTAAKHEDFHISWICCLSHTGYYSYRVCCVLFISMNGSSREYLLIQYLFGCKFLSAHKRKETTRVLSCVQGLKVSYAWQSVKLGQQLRQLCAF